MSHSLESLNKLQRRLADHGTRIEIALTNGSPVTTNELNNMLPDICEAVELIKDVYYLKKDDVINKI